MALDLSKPLPEQLLDPNGPVCLILTARLVPVGDTDCFQPAGFPEVGHVIYDAPRTDGDGRKYKEKVCIVDSPASMANHLEKVCLAGEGTIDLHPDLAGLPYVVCVTDRKHSIVNGEIVLNPDDPKDSPVVSTLTEGHRIASDYFVHPKDRPQVKGGRFNGRVLREVLHEEFGLDVVKPGATYFIRPQTWWEIYKTIFNLDPNSLVHGVMFAKEQIKISRLLTAHLEAFGAARVGRSGVKFDRLQKTTSGQPIFSVDEETADEIRATFILDLALLRSYGRGGSGLNDQQKRLVLELALWKIGQLVKQPFRYRTQCFLNCENVTAATEDGAAMPEPMTQKAAETLFASLNLKSSIEKCKFANGRTDVYYPANVLFKPGKETDAAEGDEGEEEDTE
jgi:CRISPR-associated protein Csb1